MINNVTLTGRLTADPELKTTPSGVSVVSVCIAVERRYQPKDGEKLTDFINCVAWRNTAEFITRFFRKGDMIGVVGEIQTRKYKDKHNNDRWAVEVIVNQAEFCGGKNSGNNAQEPAETEQPAPPANNKPQAWNIGDEELPF